jgi:hypothetical protein
MNRDLDVLAVMLSNPCLTADEAAREAAARRHAAAVTSELRSKLDAKRRREVREPRVESDGPTVGF